MTIVVDLDKSVTDEPGVMGVTIEMVAAPTDPPVPGAILSDSGWVHAGTPYRCVDRYVRTVVVRGRDISDEDVARLRRRLAATAYCAQQGCRFEGLFFDDGGNTTIKFATQIDSSD